MPILLLAFITMSVVWTALSLWLGARQAACVRRHRDAVPADFAAVVTLEEHRKAADYTIAHERLDVVHSLVDLGITLAWVLGGINLLYGMLEPLIAGPLTRGVAFLLAFSAIGALLSLPFDVYETFVLEQKFGFNRTTGLTFLTDHIKHWAIGLCHRGAAAVRLPLGHAKPRRAVVAVDLVRHSGADVRGAVHLRPADRAALQHLHPVARRSAVADRDAAAPVRLPPVRAVQHGRVEAVGARQRVFHRLRQYQARGAVRYAHRRQHAGRNRGGGRARTWPLPARSCAVRPDPRRARSRSSCWPLSAG